MDGGNDEPGVKRLASEPEEWRRVKEENLRLGREWAVIGNEVVMKRERVGKCQLSHHNE